MLELIDSFPFPFAYLLTVLGVIVGFSSIITFLNQLSLRRKIWQEARQQGVRLIFVRRVWFDFEDRTVKFSVFYRRRDGTIHRTTCKSYRIPTTDYHFDWTKPAFKPAMENSEEGKLI